MSGQCYRCASSFGMFKKEYGCKNCGYVFCKDCLKKKAKVPKCKNETHKVCEKCFDGLTRKILPTDDVAHSLRTDCETRVASAACHPTAAHRPEQDDRDEQLARRLHQLQAARDTHAAVPTQRELEQRVSKLRGQSSHVPTEDELAQRVSKLRGQSSHVPTEDELAQRVAKLSGRGAGKPTASLPAPDRRTQAEQTDDLLEQVQNEVAIDCQETRQAGHNQLSLNNLNKEVSVSAGPYTPNVAGSEHAELEDVERLMAGSARSAEAEAAEGVAGLRADGELRKRLYGLRENTPTTGDQTSSLDDNEAYNIEDDDEDDEEASKRLIQQILEEDALDQKLGNVAMPSKSTGKKTKAVPRDSSSDSDELPWCCICNEDAVIRCEGCDNDLYCKRCFKEGHDRFDMDGHKTSRYNPPAS